MPLKPEKHKMPVQSADVRAHNFDEVALGYTEEIAVVEADRCLNCKNKPCVQGCPVNISIPDFITKIKQRFRRRLRGNCRFVVASGNLRQSLSAGNSVRKQVYAWNQVRTCCNRQTGTFCGRQAQRLF